MQNKFNENHITTIQATFLAKRLTLGNDRVKLAIVKHFSFNFFFFFLITLILSKFSGIQLDKKGKEKKELYNIKKKKKGWHKKKITNKYSNELERKWTPIFFFIDHIIYFFSSILSIYNLIKKKKITSKNTQKSIILSFQKLFLKRKIKRKHIILKKELKFFIIEIQTILGLDFNRSK